MKIISAHTCVYKCLDARFFQSGRIICGSGASLPGYAYSYLHSYVGLVYYDCL